MVYKRASLRKLSNFITVAAFLFSSIMPSALLTTKVYAAQLTERSVTLQTSKPGEFFKTATISFRHATPGTVRGMVIHFCTTALIGTTCTTPEGLNASISTQTIDGTEFTGSQSAGNRFNLSSASGASVSAGEQYTFNFTMWYNPTSVGTFYARILTYESSTAPSSYENDGTAPGPYVDYGTVALSTTNDLTVTGTVTEKLTFCVGATDSTPDASDPDIQTCSSAGFSSAKTIGLGVITSAGTTTPVSIENGGTNTNGAFLVKTNAVNGVVISYRANQNNSSGKLKIPGATCYGSSLTDACINSAGTTKTNLSGEGFGMAITDVIAPDSITGDPTYYLVKDTQYSGNGYAWDDSGNFDEVARSVTYYTGSGTLDYILGVIVFSAKSAPTTPSGLYSVSANFVATATF